MTIMRRIIKYLPAMLAFIFVLTGSWLLIPRDNDTAEAEANVNVLVLTRTLPKGSTAIDVLGSVSVRKLPPEAVVEGAFRSLSEISTGVLAIDHAAGQQLTSLSFVRNRVAAVGPDFVVTSVRMGAQSWTGAIRIAGDVVDVYALTDSGANLVTRGAVILDAPPLAEVQPGSESVITIAVRNDALAELLVAARDERLWLVGR
jgi:hypothetical protein